VIVGGIAVVFTYSGSLKLTNISYRLGFSFVSFSCIVRSFIFSVCLRFVRVIGSFFSCIVRFVYRSLRSSV
jgi:hypothetical protein